MTDISDCVDMKNFWPQFISIIMKSIIPDNELCREDFIDESQYESKEEYATRGAHR